MARRNFSDFIRSFNDSYDLVNKVGKDYETSKLAQEKETPTYTAGQGQDLEALANAKDAEGNPYYKLGTDETGKYTVTPNFQNETGAEPAAYAPSTIAEKGVSFLGQNYNAPLSEPQRTGARQQAMAGVMEKYGDPEGAMRYRLQAKQGELTDLQLKQAQRAGVREDKADANAALMEGIDKEVGAAVLAKRTNADGTVRDMTVDDYLHASQVRAGLLVKAGRMNEAAQAVKEYSAQAFEKIKLDTEQRNQDLGRAASALGNGDTTGIKDFYNKHVPDGAHVTNVTQGKDGKLTIERTTVDGTPLPPITKHKKELLAGLNSFSDPMALYKWSQDEFANNLALKAASRADKALEIQAGTAATTNRLHNAQIGQIEEATANKRELNNIHEEINAAIDSGDTKAENLARKKLMTYTVGSKGANMTKLEAEANLYFATGKAKTMADALEMAHQKVQSSPKDDYIKLTTGAMPLNSERLNNAMETLHGKGWKAKIHGESGKADQLAGLPSFKTQSEADAAVKAGKLKPGDKVSIGGKAAVWNPPAYGGDSPKALPADQAAVMSGPVSEVSTTPVAAKPSRDFYGAEAIAERAAEKAAKKKVDDLKVAQSKAEQAKVNADIERRRQIRMAAMGGTSSLLDTKLLERP